MAEVPGSGQAGAVYRRHRPEQTLPYQLVERHYPEFVEFMRLQGRPLPTFVHREFDAFLECGRLEYGFLRVRRLRPPSRWRRPVRLGAGADGV